MASVALWRPGAHVCLDSLFLPVSPVAGTVLRGPFPQGNKRLFPGPAGPGGKGEAAGPQLWISPWNVCLPPSGQGEPEPVLQGHGDEARKTRSHTRAATTGVQSPRGGGRGAATQRAKERRYGVGGRTVLGRGNSVVPGRGNIMHEGELGSWTSETGGRDRDHV